MIFTIKDCEVRQSQTGRDYFRFILLDDYEHKWFGNLAIYGELMEAFHKKNGIYNGNRILFARDYIGFIISAKIEWVIYGNKAHWSVRLL